MSYKGFYKVKNHQKYKGDSTKCVFRSLWERKFMKYCDSNENVLEWSSEEVRIPYRSPIDGRFHWYFVDFWVKIKSQNGVKDYLIEIKPKKQTLKPEMGGKNKKTQLTEIKRYLINKEKWGSAKKYCEKRGWEFLILTEDHIFKKNERRHKKHKKNID